MDNESSSLANSIIDSRKKLGLSQEALAEKAKVSLSTIQRIEKGTVKPRSFTLKILATSLDMEASDLLSHLVDKKVPNSVFSALKKVNRYTLIFVFIPFVNLIIPSIVWKKNKQLPSNDRTAGKIISFQLLWSLGIIIGVFLTIFLTNLITGQAGLGFYVVNIFYLVGLIFNVFTVVKTASLLNKKDSNVLPFVPNLF